MKMKIGLFFLGGIVNALASQISADVFSSNAFELEVSLHSQPFDLIESDSRDLFDNLLNHPSAQDKIGDVLMILYQYIEENQSYFDSYALRESNQIGSGNVIWEEASLEFNEGDGSITLDLEGTALLPFPAALFYPNPAMQLKILFKQNSCFEYSYSCHALEVQSELEPIIRSEVNNLLENSSRDIEASLNNEVANSLSTLQLLNGLDC